MIDRNTKFRPVYGTQNQILNTTPIEGYVYVASDTGKIWICANQTLKQIGGSGDSGGGGSTSIFWANGDEDETFTIRKDTDDASDGDPIYYIHTSAIQGENKLPDKNALVINSDGRFFKVLDNTLDLDGFFKVELIAVSGGGSGGGGGGGGTSDIDLSMTWQGIDQLGSTYIYGKSQEITFIPNSLADSVFSLRITVTNSAGEKVLERSFNKVNKTKCIIDAADLPEDSSDEGLTITALLTSANSRYNKGNGLRKTFGPIRVLKMYLEKPLNLNMIGIQSGAARLSCIPYFSGLGTQKNPVQIYYSIDESVERVKGKDLVSDNHGNTQYIDIPHQAHGTHIIHLWLSVVINDERFDSDEISYEVPFIDSNNTDDTIIWIENELGTVIQYEPAVVRYMVYSPAAALSGSTIEVQILQDGALYDTAEVEYGNKWLTIDFTSRYEVGENHFSLVSGTARKDIDFFITSEGARDLSLKHKNELELNFSSLGRSNKQIKANRVKWVSEGNPVITNPTNNYEAQLNNFNWYNNGWLDDNNGYGSYLAISNGASVTIPMNTITLNTSAQPWTFEMRFRVRNAKKFATLVTEIPLYVWVKADGSQCADGEELTLEEIDALARNNPAVHALRDQDGNLVMNEKNTTRKVVRSDKYIAFRYLNSDGKGFAIGTQEAYFNAGGKVVNVKFKEDEIINISFIVNGGKQLSIYLNGILSGVANLSGISGFVMQNIPFEINSEYCDFDLYNFRVYPLTLTMPEVIHNYISDAKSVDLYDENQLTDANYADRLSYKKLLSYNDTHKDTPTMPYVVIDLSGETSSGNSELPFAKTADGIDGTRIEFTNPTADRLLETEQITAWEYYTRCPSYSANNVNINVQGTSSQIYPRRNFKTKFKKAKQWIYTFGPLAGLPVNYNYWFNTDGSVAEDVLEQSVDIQNQIAEIDKIKQPTTEDKAQKKALKTQLSDLGLGKKQLTKNWHEDSESFGSNKFTWKVDYMESSGTYNTGFANLVGNIYSKHPLEDIGAIGAGSEYRTSVYGFPMLAFHKTAEDTYTYIGRYNYNLDKSANERYGFELEKDQPFITNEDGSHPLIADVAECWELRDNQGTWCSFRYPNEMRADGFNAKIYGSTDRIEVVQHFEARYHKDADQFEWGQNVILNRDNVEDFSAEVGSDNTTISNYLLARLRNLERLFNWLDSTDKKSVTNLPLSEVIGQESIDYKVSGKVSDEEAAAQGITYYVETKSDGSTINMGTFTKDSLEYRRQKFYNEFSKHLDEHYCAIYFVMTELLLCYDSRGKNMMIATFGPHEEGGEYIWYPIFYDIDTQLGLNNVGAKLWDYDEDCTENGTFSTAQSVLWDNFYDLFKGTIVATYRRLRSGAETAVLSYKNIEGSYLCDPNVFKNSYAMRGRRPLIAMGLDIYYKYVLPVTEAWRNQEGNMVRADYLYACQGDRKLSRQLLINNRLLYMDSKWLGGSFTINTGGMAGIMFRSTANHETTTSDKYIDLINPGELQPGDDYDLTVVDPTTGVASTHHYVYKPYKEGEMKYIDSDPVYNVTPYLNFYVTTFTDENTYSNDEPFNEDKYPNGQPTKDVPSITESFKYGRVDQQLNYFAGSSYISSLGDLSTKYANQINMPYSTRLLDITLGSDHPDYFNNETLDPFKMYTDIDEETGLPIDGSEKPLLEKIILTNVRGANGNLDVRSPEKLREFRALGTNLTKVLFADGAPLDTVHLPNTIQELYFIQNKNLNRILTDTPVVAELEGNNLVYKDPSVYEGLFIDGLTNYTPAMNGQGSPISTIDFEGVNMGYDSYTILKDLVSEKLGSGREKQLHIKMTEVNWTPYVQVEYGEDKATGVSYFLLTDHSTYIDYPANRNWAEDTLNGLVYTKNLNVPSNRITDLSLFDTFLEDYADTSTSLNQFVNNIEAMMSQKTYPTISGELFVDNDAEHPIDEEELSKDGKYGKNWPDLKIRAAHVNEAYIVKYVQKLESGKYNEIETIRYKKEAEGEPKVHPEVTSKPIVKQDYDFLGWTLDPQYCLLTEDQIAGAQEFIYNNSQIEALEFSAVNNSYVFYAVFTQTKYNFNFLNSDGSYITTLEVIAGKSLSDPGVVPTSPRERTLPDNERYKFIGWVDNVEDCYPEAAELVTLIELTSIKSRIQINNKNFYACYVKENVLDNVTPLKYFYVEEDLIGDVSGVCLVPKEEYSLSGKVTLPTVWEDGRPVISIRGFEKTSAANGGFAYNITHIYWYGEPQLLKINSNCFANLKNLKYFSLPTTIETIYDQAFIGCTNLQIFNFADYNKLTFIGQSAFQGAFDKNNVPELIHLPGSVQTIQQLAFSYILGGNGTPIGALQFGGAGDPTQLQLMGDSAFLVPRTFEQVTFYITSNTNTENLQSLMGFISTSAPMANFVNA